MSRTEENWKMILNHSHNLKGVPYQEGLLMFIGAISATLFDISKSLAVIADKMTEEENK